MRILKGIFIILLHLSIGILLAGLIGNFLPGSVLGMILLFISLLTGMVKEESVREVAEFLTGNMTLFFLPAFMGIMDIWDVLKVNLAGWLIVVAVSTIAVLASSGWVQQGVERIGRKEDAE